MTFWRRLLPVLVIFPGLSFAASREIVELQRDVALLQDQLRTLQRSQDEKLSAIQTLVQQALEAANKSDTAVAVLQSNMQQTIRDQQKSVVAPVVDVGTKIDAMTGDVQAMRESVADLTSQMGKMQQQMLDIGNAVRSMQSPAAAPPPMGGPSGADPGLGAGSSSMDRPPMQGGGMSGGAPPVPASTLYQNAMRDRSGGKNDLALQEFGDYLRYYPKTDLAPNAQFYVAELHLKQNDLESALREFDLVLEKYPDNSKTPDALYMKGRTMVQMGKRTQGKQEFCELVKRFPSSDLAASAKTQVKNLGLTCGPAAATHPRKKS